jgi:zinc protease
VVAVQFWVKAGSRTESDREAGITHVMEHMIFKGTPTRGLGQVAWEVEALGGQINAYTSLDYTVYHVVIASRYARAGLEVLTDAVRHPLFDAEELEREKKVVLEELRMRDDRPAGKLQNAMFAQAFRVHPYRRPIIGFPETVASFTREDLLEYARRLYVPENITLIMTGDLDPADTMKDVRRLLEDWAPRASQGPAIQAEPPQREFRAVELREEASEAHMELAFPIPGASHEDTPALDLLAIILGEGESSRLQRTIRSVKGLVHSIGAYAYTPLDPGLFTLQAALDPEKFHSAAEEILNETFRLREEPVGPEELDKARITIEADLVRGKEAMQGKARVLGQFQLIHGGVHKEGEYLEAIRQVSPADVQRVARDYLKPERLNAVVLLPKETPVRAEPSQLNDLAQKVFAAQSVSHTGPVPAYRERAVHKEVLDNGLILLVKETHEVPTVAIQASFLAGSRFESRENAGISAVLTKMLTKGTRNRSAQQLAKEVESMGGSLEGFSGRNSVGVKAEFLSRFFPQAMEYLADVLLHSTMDPEELEKERPRLLAAVRREQDQPTQFAFQLFASTLFRVHPYGLRRGGTEESIAALQRSDLQAYYRRVILPENGVLAIVGDVSVEEASRWAKRYMGAWRAGRFSPVVVPQEPALEEIRIARQDSPRQQVHVVLGFPGATLGGADQCPLQVLDTVLSGQGGRLFKELRDRQGLAYTVTSFSQLGLDPGYFGTYIATSPENLTRAIEGLKEELQRTSREIISPEELERAKRHIVGSYEIGQQTHSSQAMTMALDERYGLGFDYGTRYLQAIQSVTQEDVLRVAKKYIRMDRYVLAIVGPDS